MQQFVNNHMSHQVDTFRRLALAQEIGPSRSYLISWRPDPTHTFTMPGATLFDLGGLQIDLEEMLGVPVDLLTPGNLPAKIRDKVLHEAKAI